MAERSGEDRGRECGTSSFPCSEDANVEGSFVLLRSCRQYSTDFELRERHNLEFNVLTWAIVSWVVILATIKTKRCSTFATLLDETPKTTR